ncbi:triple tyrosine motif-containing protein [Sediminibacter sp. Hel_I_10]|uniref:helix-turn-helix and ligand-binding sensor domain-containing protein n=1 Tax=Sediminibacter sp. Hel_I_10 TaxID=1392490 RepID=UPI000562561B|nr:triple tyrosine motif-containing protein [Sediminibacter sp. Hel_I_10]
MKLKLRILSSICLLISCLIWAQELPPIASYSTEDYRGENQNWAISQAPNKFIYVANNKGLLEFNGANWQLYPSPNETILRSVHVVGDKIYTGCYMEFGYWQHDNYNKLHYTSLSKDITESLITDEQFWNIISFNEWVLFQSFNRIYIYNSRDQQFSTIDSKTMLTKMIEVDGVVYFQKLNDGIYQIVNGKERLLTDDPVLSRNTLVNIFKKDQGLLIETQDQGFFTYVEGETSKWDIPANKKLNTVSVYNSIKLQDQRLALGTISNGVIVLTETGSIDYTINQSTGLSNNTVLSLFEDVEQNIWLGLDNGINCLNTNSPFRIFQDDNGSLGTVYAAIVHDGLLYLGTNQGLFYRTFESNDDFALVDGTRGQVWTLKTYDNQLFIGHNLGTFVLKNKELEQISFDQGTWDIQEIEGQPNLLLQGNYYGLSVLERNNNKWTLRNKVDGFNISSKYFGISKEARVFVNHEYKGVYKLQLNQALTKVLEVERDTSLGKGLNSSLLKYGADIIYAYKQGVFKYDVSEDRFKKDSILSQFYDSKSYLSGKLIKDSLKHWLWGFTENDVSYVSQGQMTITPKVTHIPFPNSVRKMMIGYENILNLGGERYLLGTSTGYIIMDLNKVQTNDYEVSINTIENYSLHSNRRTISKNESVELENGYNNIKFSYSVPEYKKFVQTKYKYKLDGIYNEWSNWSTQSNTLFENLPSGAYDFQVRSKVGNTESKNIASFTFNIQKPWYATNLAIAMYLLIVVLFSVFMHNVYKSYYKKQKEKLILANKRDLELKELETEQQLMQLKNESLQQDIENKNRELAISTMSLIKKNEFLNSIKDELKSSETEKGLKSVVKIIDKNINNTDDWKFFQEAFNNADKDFLKKVKSIHPKLTPNDLKLCAYLRLNLTSKEIAPLLNISPRSVEVKRYRLRKKMNLPHEASLTNYILEM